MPPLARVRATAENRTLPACIPRRCSALELQWQVEALEMLALPFVLRWTDGESNPDYLCAKQVCSRYHYQPVVESPGIEPGSHVCQTRVFPLDHDPAGRRGIEPPPMDLESSWLP